ncbi:hypothetical protein V492_02906 [Pseudogymnoascus sp. VKM F-4246]|nr:hypothetical protein V492_02906 [Pseudogymnoascus sp. VKM F-4246]
MLQVDSTRSLLNAETNAVVYPLSLMPPESSAGLKPLSLSFPALPHLKSDVPSIITAPLVPPPRRLRARTPRHAPLIPPPLPQPLPRAHIQLSLQLRARILAMDEIAEAGAHAPLAGIEATARLAEVGHGAQLAVDGARSVPARVEGVAGLLRGVFVLESRVDVADEICAGSAWVFY